MDRPLSCHVADVGESFLSEGHQTVIKKKRSTFDRQIYKATFWPSQCHPGTSEHNRGTSGQMMKSNYKIEKLLNHNFCNRECTQEAISIQRCYSFA